LGPFHKTLGVPSWLRACVVRGPNF